MTRRYDVTLTAPGGTRIESLEAETPYLAANLAERLHPEAKVVTVSTVWRFIGRCARCEAMLFDGDAGQKRRGELRCGECA